MGSAKKICTFVFGMALVATAAWAGSVTIEQIPPDASDTSGILGESAIKVGNEAESPDYQNQILSNPVYSAPARANALIDGNANDKIGGNTAVIKQQGNSNTSSIVQQGDNNHATQSQKGTMNDLRVEQNGQDNVSDEQQTGSYNHKVKIQNGNRDESLTIEQVAPEPSDKP
ncbi:MAG: hypothetical protein P4M13_08875 [Alphaproteobacteria bacterium]|nr:hypothetical protein [Alphaproteobacteria bacterium]